ncbi:probable cytochrome P450 6a14 [Hylaeus volcanicus]|uniref:probable cytochrome P450 6a14 n=1 Tax=Hylaeus volcanicus TaxID=313075 RepID=UPI0023B88232|nr:probable cytochrome P450 6a14 [Hylaeus volcanicus]
MSWPLVETLGLFAAALFLFYYYATSTFDFWRKRGVKGPKPLPYVGNFMDVFLGKGSVSDCFVKAYYEFKDEPMIGVFGGRTPLLVLKDPDLMKDVLIKDFSVFAERTLGPVDDVEPLSVHLFRLDAPRWKPLRTRLSPVFTSGKLKEMFHLLLECSDHFVKYIEAQVDKGEPIECREIAAKYTTDVIGNCAFGLEMNALGAEDSPFRKIGRQIFQTSWKTFFRDRLREYPFLFKIVGRFFVDNEVNEFLTGITRETVNYRIKNNVRRNDFMDALVELKQHPEKLGIEKMTEQYLTAQAFVFFVAGFETSSVTISHVCFELALNPPIQEKLREDIKHVLRKTNGQVTYDCIKEMHYLDACLKETLRKYPVVLYLSRLALENYTFSGTKVSIPKGQQVFMPVVATQHDPDIYPDPEVFDPDRFTDGNDKSRHPMFFLPFGDGPRNCIGARFANYQSKLAIIRVLTDFKLEVCEKTQIPYIVDKKALFLLQPTHGIYVRMTKLTK